MTDSFFSYQIPNLLLAMAMYTLLGRFVLSFFFAHESEAAFWKVLRQITDPFVTAASYVTPLIVPRPLLVLVAVVWLFALRILFFLVAVMYGFAPRIGG
jgi:hypothetical protein